MSFDEGFEEKIQRNKEKTSWGFLIILLSSIIILALLILWPVISHLYDMRYKEKTLEISESPSSINTIEIYEIGRPFLHGVSTVRMKYGEKEKEVQIDNNGRPLKNSDVSVKWNNDSEALITLSDTSEYLEEKLVSIQFK
ncbi:hypothetical protein KFZ56_18330 [Virgibacillus sp. NKC19-3]|uniref:hypothetical protein n=1 Tax=Virgibacillus saliphilus TaxID=2831674 RepID=UPI001C9B01D7|nr:hypothetical protein [Virgibacillus sp. NKC19-3]MBY7144977.1 hypothetical protein [Virgibacillus sp. NKC19-3]